MRESQKIEQFLNRRDLPAYQKYFIPKSKLYNLKQFLIDNEYAKYNASSKLYQINKTSFAPSWNMSYLYAEGLDFTSCSVFGCHLVYGDYSGSLFTTDTFLSEGDFNSTNFSFSKCHSTIFSSPSNHSRAFININLSNCNLTGAIFNGLQFYNISFHESYLLNCQFINCELNENVIFDFSNIEKTYFNHCNIYSSSFQNSDLEDTIFFGCCIRGSDGNEINFKEATLDNIQLNQDSSGKCDEISFIDLRNTHIKNSQLTALKLSKVKINSQFSIENSAVYDTRINLSSDQYIESCQLAEYFNCQEIYYENVKFSPPGYICWYDSNDDTSFCKDSHYNTRPLIPVLIGAGSVILLILLIIAIVKIYRNYIHPNLIQRQMIKQLHWKTWPLTKALSDSDVDALHQIREMAGKYSNQIPRDVYKLILNMRAGQSDEKYRISQHDFGDLLPSYQAPAESVRATGIRFFDMKDRRQYRRKQIDHTITQFFRHPIQRDEELIKNNDEATPLLSPEIF